MTGMKRVALALFLWLFCAPAWAQTEGIELNMGATPVPWNGGVSSTYHHFRFTHVRNTNAPSGALVSSAYPGDYYIQAWKSGWIAFTGNVRLILDTASYPPGFGTNNPPNYTLRVFKNGPANGCEDETTQLTYNDPRGSRAGYQAPGLWYVIDIPMNIRLWTEANDKWRFCMVATSDKTLTIDGNTGHTQLAVTISSTSAP